MGKETLIYLCKITDDLSYNRSYHYCPREKVSAKKFCQKRNYKKIVKRTAGQPQTIAVADCLN